jgi:hypothetical protein
MSGIEVSSCRLEDRDRWNAFVARANNGTVFHNLDFLSYHPAERFAFDHLLFHHHGKLVAVLPGGVAGSEYRSPTGASLGGFAVEAGLSLETADAVVKALLAYCRKRNIHGISLTPPMQVYQETVDEVMEYALLYNGFKLQKALYSSVIDLSRVRGKSDLSRNTRHKINKAINKNVLIVQENDFETFYPILLENKAKFKTKPTHTLEELHRIDTLHPGMMRLFLAMHKGRAVAGELLFAANRTCVLNFYTMHKYEHRNLFSVNYLVEHALRWSAAQGFRYYDYGVSPDTFSSNPLEPSWPLIRFKESMGSTGCMRKTWHRTLPGENP